MQEIKETTSKSTDDNPAKETSKPSSSSKVESEGSIAGEKIDFKVVFNKKKFDVSFGSEETVGALKACLQDIIGVPSTMQKVMIKGMQNFDF